MTLWTLQANLGRKTDHERLANETNPATAPPALGDVDEAPVAGDCGGKAMNPDIDDLADALDGDLASAARVLGRRGGLTRGKSKRRSREHYQAIGKLGAEKRWRREKPVDNQRTNE